jgi:hypothetical protein
MINSIVKNICRILWESTESICNIPQRGMIRNPGGLIPDAWGLPRAKRSEDPERGQQDQRCMVKKLHSLPRRTVESLMFLGEKRMVVDKAEDR